MNLNFAYLVVDEDVSAGDVVYIPGVEVKEVPQKPEPQIPPPCWDSREIRPDACWSATKAMCG